MTSLASQKPRRLAIVGASVRAAAESAIAAGYEVVGADLFADADHGKSCPTTRVERYPEGLIDWLAEQEVDGWLYTGAMENYPEVVDQMSETAPLLGVHGNALRRVRDPVLLQEELAGAEVLFPETHRFDGKIPAEGDWLVKTYRHSSGAGVRVLNERAPSEGDYVQRRVSGRNAAATFAISEKESALFGVTEQLVGTPKLHAPVWGYCGSVGPIVPTEEVSRSLVLLGEVLRSRFGLLGLVGADLVIEGDRVWLLEINPRYTASVEVLERAKGQSAIEAHVACFTGATIGSWSTQGASPHAKAILFAKQDVIISDEFHLWAMKQNAKGRVSDIPHAGESITAGSPVVTLYGDPTVDDELIGQAERLLYAS